MIISLMAPGSIPKPVKGCCVQKLSFPKLSIETIFASQLLNSASSLYCNWLANSNIQFFVMPSVTCECNPKIPEFVNLFLYRSIQLQQALISVFET